MFKLKAIGDKDVWLMRFPFIPRRQVALTRIALARWIEANRRHLGDRWLMGPGRHLARFLRSRDALTKAHCVDDFGLCRSAARDLSVFCHGQLHMSITVTRI